MSKFKTIVRIIDVEFSEEKSKQGALDRFSNELHFLTEEIGKKGMIPKIKYIVKKKRYMAFVSYSKKIKND